jgi:hypothetical protein
MVSLTTVVTVIVAVATAYPTARAVLAQEIKDQIKQEIKPLQDAQIITISATVRNLRNAIVALEFKRDMCGGNVDGCWTLRDAEDLTSVRVDLTAAEAALKALRE